MAKKTPKTAEWRKFEKLVSRIEKHLAGCDITVKSPDRLPNLHTGRKREVDATIRYRVGSTQNVMSIECRKRKLKQDVVWIEQLATKKAALGLQGTIAVSSTGFSKEALAQARLYGITTRTLDDLSPEDVTSFVNALPIQAAEVDWAGPATVRIHLFDSEPSPDALLAPAFELIRKVGMNAKIFRKVDGDVPFGMQDVLDEKALRLEGMTWTPIEDGKAIQGTRDDGAFYFYRAPWEALLLAGVRFNGERVIKRLSVDFNAKIATVLTTTGEAFVRRFELYFPLIGRMVDRPPPVLAAARYGGPGESSYHYTERELSITGGIRINFAESVEVRPELSDS